MKIGIDASRLTEFNRTGTENYLYYVVKSLSKLDFKNEYILYLKHEPGKDGRFWRDLTGGNGRFSYKVLGSSLSWTQVALALECLAEDIDILLETWQTMPIVHKRRTKIVSVIHGMEYSRWRGGPTFYSCLFADKLVAVSNFTKDQIIAKTHIRGEKISVVYEGVDKSVFYKRSLPEIAAVRSNYNIPADYILSLGSYGKRKNIEGMFGALTKVIEAKDYSKPPTLVLAGKGFDGHDIVPRSILGNVKILGYADQDTLPALISGAKFLLYPSLSEGFGLPILESMACGTPVLTSNTSAMKEIGGKAAYFVDPASEDSMYLGMTSLLKDEDLLKKMSVEGIKWVENFSWDKCAQLLLGVFEESWHDKK